MSSEFVVLCTPTLRSPPLSQTQLPDLLMTWFLSSLWTSPANPNSDEEEKFAPIFRIGVDRAAVWLHTQGYSRVTGWWRHERYTTAASLLIPVPHQCFLPPTPRPVLPSPRPLQSLIYPCCWARASARATRAGRGFVWRALFWKYFLWLKVRRRATYACISVISNIYEFVNGNQKFELSMRAPPLASPLPTPI